MTTDELNDKGGTFSDWTEQEIEELLRAIMDCDEALEYLFGARPEIHFEKPDWLLQTEANNRLRFALPFDKVINEWTIPL